MLSFENFVKSMPPSLSELKVTPSFCFAFKIPDDVAPSNMYIDIRLFSAFQDLHRTGCSLFCGEDAHANQLMLKRVLLAYARWNKSIGYCQGFNMLAAIILEEST